MPSGFDPTGGYRFSEKIMLRDDGQADILVCACKVAGIDARGRTSHNSSMGWLRAKTLAVGILVALFLAAQFAGVVASPLKQAHAAGGPAVEPAGHHHNHTGVGHAGVRHAGAERVSKHHADTRRHDGCVHPDACTDHADYCCALHAFFAGILPPTAAIEHVVLTGERLRPAVTDIAPGLHPARLDRPPRSQS
jgi:hypothetical protein